MQGISEVNTYGFNSTGVNSTQFNDVINCYGGDCSIFTETN